MTKRELRRLRDLLVKFSETTDDDEGQLRDDIAFVIHKADERLGDD